MILGIGIDSVEIERFTDWNKKTKTELLRIFSQDEITYCTSNKNKSAERFAVRFAAREAVYKAFSPFAKGELPFLTVCKSITIKKKKKVPSLLIDWEMIIDYLELPCDTETIQIHISLTHTKNVASVFVILENITN